MLGQPVCGEHVRESLVRRFRIWIVGPLFPIGGRIALLARIQRIFCVRFQRLVVRGQRSILQTRSHPDPSCAVGMHDEGRIAGESFIATLLGISFRVGPLLFREIGNVMAAPLPFCFIPPDQFFPLAPRLAIRRGGTAVVQDAPIERPRESPAVTVAAAGLAFVRDVLAVVHAGVDPAAAGCRAVGFEVREVFYIAVDLAQHSIGVVVFVIPGERAQAGVAGSSRRFRLETPA